MKSASGFDALKRLQPDSDNWRILMAGAVLMSAARTTGMSFSR